MQFPHMSTLKARADKSHPSLHFEYFKSNNNKFRTSFQASLLSSFFLLFILPLPNKHFFSLWLLIDCSWSWSSDSHTHIHIAQLYAAPYLSHTTYQHQRPFRVCVLPKDTLEGELEEPGIKPPTFWFVNVLLSHSCPHGSHLNQMSRERMMLTMDCT